MGLFCILFLPTLAVVLLLVNYVLPDGVALWLADVILYFLGSTRA
jgi:hypothetical protein